jgi:hypothetical protein
VSRKKESGSFGEMVRRGAERLARDQRAQRTAKKGSAGCWNASVVDKVGNRSYTIGVSSEQEGYRP